MPLRSTVVRRTCQSCGAKFSVKKIEVLKGWGNFCSNACKHQSMTTSVYEKLDAGRTKITPSGCVEWLGTRCRGYGQIRVSNSPVRYRRTHVLAWERVHGPVPKGKCICHHCDNPPCINVDHLFLGTQTDNMADMRSKSRHTKGENCSLSKLTAKKVQVIRRLYASGEWTMQKLAERFKTTIGNIHAIVHRRSWKHIV